MLTGTFDACAVASAPCKGEEDGLIYRRLEPLWCATGEDLWLSRLRRMADAQIGPGGRLAGYDPSDYTVDHILSGRTVLVLHKVTGAPRNLEAASSLMDQLAPQPRTRLDVCWHKLRNPWQVWPNMGRPLQIGSAQRTGAPEKPRSLDAMPIAGEATG